MDAALAAKDTALAKQAHNIAELHQQSSSLTVPLTVATAAGTKSTTVSAGLSHLSLHAPADAAQSLASDMSATIPCTRKFMQRLKCVGRMLEQKATEFDGCLQHGGCLHAVFVPQQDKHEECEISFSISSLAAPSITSTKIDMDTTAMSHQAPANWSAVFAHLASSSNSHFAVCTPPVNAPADLSALDDNLILAPTVHGCAAVTLGSRSADTGINITTAAAAPIRADSSTTLFASTVTPVARLPPSEVGVFGAFGAALAPDLAPTHHPHFCLSFDLDMPFLLVASHSPTATTTVGPSTSTTILGFQAVVFDPGITGMCTLPLYSNAVSMKLLYPTQAGEGEHHCRLSSRFAITLVEMQLQYFSKLGSVWSSEHSLVGMTTSCTRLVVICHAFTRFIKHHCRASTRISMMHSKLGKVQYSHCPARFKVMAVRTRHQH
jgi:hypothetical protein